MAVNGYARDAPAFLWLEDVQVSQKRVPRQPSQDGRNSMGFRMATWPRDKFLTLSHADTLRENLLLRQ